MTDEKKEQPAEPTGCVLDWGWLKAFEGQKGQAVCWKVLKGNDWYVRSRDEQFTYERTESEALAKCREMAGLEPEPDEPPEAFAQALLDAYPTIKNDHVDQLWRMTQEILNAKEEGGE